MAVWQDCARIGIGLIVLAAPVRLARRTPAPA
jgi:hypothetical protein